MKNVQINRQLLLRFSILGLAMLGLCFFPGKEIQSRGSNEAGNYEVLYQINGKLNGQPIQARARGKRIEATGELTATYEFTRIPTGIDLTVVTLAIAYGCPTGKAVLGGENPFGGDTVVTYERTLTFQKGESFVVMAKCEKLNGMNHGYFTLAGTAPLEARTDRHIEPFIDTLSPGKGPGRIDGIAIINFTDQSGERIIGMVDSQYSIDFPSDRSLETSELGYHALQVTRRGSLVDLEQTSIFFRDFPVAPIQ